MVLKCTALDALLPEYLDGELNSHNRQKLEKHLADCPDCQHELASQREWLLHRHTVQSWSEKRSVPEGLNERILAAVRTEAADSKHRLLPAIRWTRILPRLAGAAAAVVLLVAFLQIYQNLGRSASATTAAFSMTRAGMDLSDKSANPATANQELGTGKAVSAAGSWQIFGGSLKDLQSAAGYASQDTAVLSSNDSSVVADSLDKAQVLQILTNAGPPARTLILAAWPASEIDAQADLVKNAFATCGTPARIEIIRTGDLRARLNNVEQNLYAKVFKQPPVDLSWIFILIGE